jgi:uncharacterized protein YneF (UPF0154 family)
MLEIIKILAVIVGVVITILVVLIILSIFITDKTWKNATKAEDERRRKENFNFLSGQMGINDKNKRRCKDESEK